MGAAFWVIKHLKSMADSNTIPVQKTRQLASSGGRIAELQAQIEELKKRWPAHSVPPSMLLRLDELEEELENELKSPQGGG